MARYEIKREAWNEKTYNGYIDNPYWLIRFDEKKFMVKDNGEVNPIGGHNAEVTELEKIRIKEIVKECNLNIPNLFDNEIITDAKNTHQAIRDILQKYGNPEFGDCIVDEICFQFGFPTTTDVEPEK